MPRRLPASQGGAVPPSIRVSPGLCPGRRLRLAALGAADNEGPRSRFLQPTALGQMAALALVYGALARFALKMDAVAGFAAVVWPPSGIALAALLRGSPDLWPGIAVGAFVANVWAGAPPLVAAGIAAG